VTKYSRKERPGYPSHLIGKPALLQSQDELFKTETEMRSAISALINYLKKSSNGQKGSSDVLNLMFQELRVEFSDKVETLRVRAEYGQSAYVIIAPIIPNESQENRREREKSILTDFIPTIAESQLRATIQLYRTLSTDARKRLIKRFGPRSNDAKPDDGTKK